jgi:hypothetical protein
VNVMGVDLTLLAGIWFAAACMMILLLTCAVRLALVPLLDAWTRARRLEHDRRAQEALATRISSIEQRLEQLSRTARAPAWSGAGTPGGP